MVLKSTAGKIQDFPTIVERY